MSDELDSDDVNQTDHDMTEGYAKPPKETVGDTSPRVMRDPVTGKFLAGTKAGPGDEELTPAVDLGFGADLRLSRAFALGGRYMYHGFWLDQAHTAAGETNSTWSAMGTATVYF